MPFARMPKGGFYFDAIIRQQPIDWSKLDLKENLEEFGTISNEELECFRYESERLYTQSDKAIFANLHFWTGFGDIALIPGLQLKIARMHPIFKKNFYADTLS